MSPRPKKTPTAPAPQAKVFRRKRAAPQPTPRDASAPDYSHTPLDAIPLTGLPPRALIAPNFRMYELTKSDLAARLGIDNGFTSEAHLRAAIHLARQVLQPIRDAFGSFSPNSVYRSQKLERALKNKPASWLSTSQHAKGEACDIEIVANRRWMGARPPGGIRPDHLRVLRPGQGAELRLGAHFAQAAGCRRQPQAVPELRARQDERPAGLRERPDGDGLSCCERLKTHR